MEKCRPRGTVKSRTAVEGDQCGFAPRRRGHTIGRPCEIGVQVVFIPASSLVITTEDICRKGVHTGRLLKASGGPRQCSRVACGCDDGTEPSTVTNSGKNDNSISAPESHIARLYNFTPQRAIPCLSTHSSLLDTPREPPRIEGRAPDAIPRKLCRCSAGLQ
jgi:hypothetical protein